MKLYEKQKEEAEKNLKSSNDVEEKDRLEKFLKSEGKLVGSLPLGTEASIKKSNDESKKISVGNTTSRRRLESSIFTVSQFFE